MICKSHYILLISMLWMGLLSGQTDWVLPGDANRNGLVDHYDVLPTGYAYGHFGPSRPAGDPRAPQEVIEHWGIIFPTGTDFIHADADGNGFVALPDFLRLNQNFGLATEDIQPLNFPIGTPELDPSVLINDGQDLLLSPGVTEWTVDVDFAAIDAQEEVNGLAFDIIYDEAYFEEIDFSFGSSWISADGLAFQLVRPEPGVIQVAVTRYGSDPVLGGGGLGTLGIVIIDDLIDLLEGTTDTVVLPVAIENIQAFDGDFEPVPVVGGSLRMVLVNQQVVDTEDLPSPTNLAATVYPNPTTEWVEVRARRPITALQLIDPAGRVLLRDENIPQLEFRLDLPPDLPPARYWLLLSGPDGRTRIPIVCL